MHTLVIGDDRLDKTRALIEEHKSKYRRVIAFSKDELDAYNTFDDILLDILEHAVRIRKQYPDREFPYLFVFHGMDMSLKYNCKPVFADFFRTTNWIVTTINGFDLPSFIREATSPTLLTKNKQRKGAQRVATSDTSY
jgi:hypothetical protein